MATSLKILRRRPQSGDRDHADHDGDDDNDDGNDDDDDYDHFPVQHTRLDSKICKHVIGMRASRVFERQRF